MRVALLAGALAGAALVLPATAAGAVTVGSSLPEAEGALECLSPDACTAANLSLPGATMSVPSHGVIVRWRSRVAPVGFGAGDAVALRVLRPAGDQFTGVGRSAPGAPRGDGSVTVFPTRISVQPGDRIGIDLDNGEEAGLHIRSAADSTLIDFDPRLGDGETRAADGEGPSDAELLLNADIEPDRDTDGYGDETQDACPLMAETHDPCPVRLQLTGGGGRGPVAEGGRLNYEFRLQRGSGPPAFDSRVHFKLPPELTVVSATVSQGSCSTAAGQVTCELGELNWHGVASVTGRIATTVKPGAGGRAGPRTILAEATASTTTAVHPDSRRSLTLVTSVLAPGACTNAWRGGPLVDLRSGTPGGDRLTGEAGNDRLAGYGGADCLSGGSGNDTLRGGDGDDRLAGGSGADRLEGGRGHDRLDGGRGRDRMVADSGNDSISAFDRQRDVIDCGRGRDRVTVDRLDRVRGCERVRRR